MIEQKKHYETTIILNASLEDTQIEPIITQTSETITRNGGEISAINKWGRKRLAYTIKKKNNGYYVNIEYIAPGTVISQLERMLLLDENVIRFLTIQLDKKALLSREQSPTTPVIESIAEPEATEHIPLFEDDEEPIIPITK